MPVRVGVSQNPTVCVSLSFPRSPHTTLTTLFLHEHRLLQQLDFLRLLLLNSPVALAPDEDLP